MAGTVDAIHIGREAGAPMAGVAYADVVAGAGLVGDRYSAGSGFWKDARVSRAVTLVESEVLGDLRAQCGIDIAPGELRRNITTRDIALNELVGQSFWIGDVLARGTGLCEPCVHLAELTGKPILRPLVHRGGLRADALSGGRIHVGDPIEPIPELAGVSAVVFNAGRLLLSRRLSTHGFGTWSTPGGKPLPEESFAACALRELEEETGMVGTATTLLGETLDGFPESRMLYRTRFYRVDTVGGTPEAKEPHKTGSWHWFGPEEIPQPLFRPVATAIERRLISEK